MNESRAATLGSVSSAPHSPVPPDRPGGETGPYVAIQDPELRLAVMRAHHTWAAKYAPWLLQRWLDD